MNTVIMWNKPELPWAYMYNVRACIMGSGFTLIRFQYVLGRYVGRKEGLDLTFSALTVDRYVSPEVRLMRRGIRRNTACALADFNTISTSQAVPSLRRE